MMAKTLKQNGHRAHQTTFQGLTEDELRDPDETKARKLFNEEIEKRLWDLPLPSRKISVMTLNQQTWTCVRTK
jgi:hypothetical protein